MNGWRSVLVLLWLLVGIPGAEAALVGITGGRGVESELYELDPNTGAVLRRIGSTGILNAGGFALHPLTRDLYVHQNVLPFDEGRLYRVDPVSLAATLLGETHMSVDDLAFAPDGTLYGWMEFHDGVVFDPATIYELVTFDLVTGAGTITGSSDLETFRNGLAFSRSGELYLKGREETLVPGGPSEFHSELFRLDRVTANRTHVVRLHDAAFGPGSDIHPSDVLAFDGNDHAFTILRHYDDTSPFLAPVFLGSFLQRIDLTTGAVTTIGGDLGLEFTALAFTSTTAVPEPGTSTAILGVMAAAAMFRGRKRRRTVRHDALAACGHVASGQ